MGVPYKIVPSLYILVLWPLNTCTNLVTAFTIKLWLSLDDYGQLTCLCSSRRLITLLLLPLLVPPLLPRSVLSSRQTQLLAYLNDLSELIASLFCRIDDGR